MPMGAMGDYCFIDHDGVRLGAIMQKPPQSPIASWLPYFGVTSASAAKRAIEAGGGIVMHGRAPGAGRRLDRHGHRPAGRAVRRRRRSIESRGDIE